jgi:hypothetical protein
VQAERRGEFDRLSAELQMRQRVKIRTKSLMERQTECMGGTKELINQEEMKEGKEQERRGRRRKNRPDIKYTKKLKTC